MEQAQKALQALSEEYQNLQSGIYSLQSSIRFKILLKNMLKQKIQN